MKFPYKYILFYFCWNLLVKYHFPSPLSGVIFAAQFVDRECLCLLCAACISYIARFSQGIKRSNFLHKILDPPLDFNGLLPLGLFSHVHLGNRERGHFLMETLIAVIPQLIPNQRLILIDIKIMK